RILILGLYTTLGANVAHAQFHDLTKRIPDGANTIILIDVDKLLNSPIGKKEGWRDQHLKAFEAGVAAVPPSATKFVKAAKLDFSTMDAEWEVSLLDLKYDPSIPKVALRYQGTIDNISGREVAVLPGDMYVVKFGPRFAAVGAPAKRQDVARWINRIYSNSLRGLSPYLAEAQKFAEASSPITMAIDLTHTFSPALVKERLQNSDALKGKDIDLDKLSEALSSIRGVSLGIAVRENRVGAIKVDFAKDVSILGDLAKPILLEALGNNGAMIEEFKDWDVRVTGKRIQITGTLYQSGMRRILSLLDPPPSLRQAASQTSPNDPQAKQKLVVFASQTYYKSIVSLLGDLRADKAGRKTMGQISVWFGKYARRIDRLSMVNVDPDVLDYGKFVSESLRTGQAEVTGAAARSRVRQQQVPEQYDVQTYSVPIGVNWRGSYGWNGWTATPNRTRTGQLKAKVRSQERIRGSMSANLILQHIDNATSDIRRYMTQKYNVDF
ncbi:MAG: hypothetical protein IH991_21765, partial [Planctomycetes bacterium]|nr:hypothetical protein [Planctomycetota bacterium]